MEWEGSPHGDLPGECFCGVSLLGDPLALLVHETSRRVALLIALLLALPMAGQPPQKGLAPLRMPERPSLFLKTFENPPRLDSSPNLIDWEGYRLPITFSPFQPSSKGELPSGMETVVYAGWGKDGLYVAVEAFDSKPDRIVAGLRMRDTIPKAEDYISVIVDPTGREHYGYEFRVNASGVQQDARVIETSGLDSSYDLLWASKTARTDHGYIVKMHIPYRSLGEVRGSWRFRVLRNWPRERFYTVTWPLQDDKPEALLRNSGFVNGCTSPHGSGTLMAIVSATAERSYDVVDGRQAGRNLGMDLRWRSENGTRADLTVKPDFSSVESDVNPLAVNTRYKTQLPEKRPFFQEGMETLMDKRVVQQLDTRSILRPLLGLKASSTSGDLSWGVLAVRDNGGGDSMATDGAATNGLRTNDFAGAFTYGDKLPIGLDGRSGLMVTNRAVLDAPDGADWHSTTYGLHTVQHYQGIWTIYGDGALSDYRLPLIGALGTATLPISSTHGTAIGYGINYDDEHVNAAYSAARTSPDARMDMGFQSITGFNSEKMDVSYRLRSNRSFWTHLKLGAEVVNNNNWDGSPFSHATTFTVSAFFKQTINLSLSRQLASREWYLGEAHDTPDTLIILSVGSIPGQRFLVASSTGRVVDYYQGISAYQKMWLGGLTGRVGPVAYKIQPVSIILMDPSTGFVTLDASRIYGKVEWALPFDDWFLRTEYQIVRKDRLLDLSDPSSRSIDTTRAWELLLRWQPNPFAGVFVGYSQSRDLMDNLRNSGFQDGALGYDHLAQKGLFVKASYSVQF